MAVTKTKEERKKFIKVRDYRGMNKRMNKIKKISYVKSRFFSIKKKVREICGSYTEKKTKFVRSGVYY